MKRSIAAIIVRDGKFFVARRPFGGPIGMMWEFPGGKLEDGESDEEALSREFDEEFGAAIAPVRMLGQTHFMHNGTDRELAAWLAELPEGSKLDLREHSECRWVTLDELESLSLADSDRALIGFLKGI